MIPGSWYALTREGMSRTAIVAILLALATPGIAGQQAFSVSPAAPADLPAAETIQKSVDEVNMFFSVLDGHGRAVTGLEASEFSVLDGGQAMPISFFQSETDAPLHLTVAIDLSGSVAPWLKYELKVATEFLSSTVRPGDTAEVTGFGTQVFTYSDPAKARERLLAIAKKKPNMGTAFYDAVRYATRQNAEARTPARRRNILVLLSDGVDNASRATAEEALRAVAESGTIVFVVYTGNLLPDRFLHEVAKRSGGRMFNAGSLGNPAKALSKVAGMLRTQYVIAFHPPDLRQDGSFHEVKIRMLRKGAKVYCRNGYYALAQTGRR